jgi:hypothetical protein
MKNQKLWPFFPFEFYQVLNVLNVLNGLEQSFGDTQPIKVLSSQVNNAQVMNGERDLIFATLDGLRDQFLVK